jgi:ABC-2 type transport system ATP-binding protein
MSGTPVVQCSGLTMAYGSRDVVSGVTLELEAGAVYALLGRNGAGKSTLLRGLLGFEKPRAGGARLFGLEAWKERAQLMERVGIVPETSQVPPRMTAAEASAFCGRLCAPWDAEGVAARLRRFDVDPGRPVGALSRGQQTQVSLALALGAKPELLVLDDPTLGLDPVARRDLYREILEDLAERGTTVLIATHDLGGIDGIADRVGILHQGRMLLDEGAESLKARFRRIHCPPGFPEAALGPLGPRVLERGSLGLEATVGAFTDEALAGAGLEPGAAAGASLEEIFLAAVAVEVQS